MSIIVCLFAFLLISVVTIESFKDEKQVGETTEKSKTKIEKDGFVAWMPGGYVIWETSNGNTFEGSSGNVVTFPSDGKRSGGGNVVKFPGSGKWGNNGNVNEGRKSMVGKACTEN